MLLLGRRFTTLARPLLALLFAAGIAAYPCRVWADPGNGRGNANGHGTRDGNGNGNGQGNGHGHGDGEGNGNGDGNGNGHGNGNGDDGGGGTGSGSGSGTGSGGGTGTGTGGSGTGSGGGTGTGGSGTGSGTGSGNGGSGPGTGTGGTGDSGSGPGTPNNNRGHGRSTNPISGSYVIIVRGFYATDPSDHTGNTAAVSAGSVTLTASVKDDAGHVLPFSAPNLRIADNYHFSGTGTVGGTAITLDGHIDPPDPANTGRGNGSDRQVVFRGRLECSYTTSDHHSGRVAGSFVPPAAPPAPASSTSH